jgi:hypothetical protein
MANQVPNSWKSQLLFPYMAATFKMILMSPGFVFNKDTHKTYADISASELPTGNGYTAGGLTLSGITRTTNDVDDRCELTWNNAQWNATGGSIITSGAIIYMSVAAGGIYELTNPVLSYKDAGGTITATDGTPIIVSAIMETVEDKV